MLRSTLIARNAMALLGIQPREENAKGAFARSVVGQDSTPSRMYHARNSRQDFSEIPALFRDCLTIKYTILYE